jgi:LAO/AO transport system kinase
MVPELLNSILKGDVLAAARFMRSVEDEEADAVEAMASIYLHTGQAFVVGVTGAPGVGKSTLLGSLISIFRKNKGMTIGVVAVDQTSPFTGGAVLGDRIRMQSRKMDSNVFIRSLASRGWRGGLSRATIYTIDVMDAMGKEIIFVETVGSGQGEMDIASVADTCIVVLTPGMGDDIQMMKAGILEVADIFVINKADREGADSLKAWLETMLEMKVPSSDKWQPPVVLTEANTGKGVEQLAEEIFRYKGFVVSSGGMEKRRRQRAKLELLMAVESAIKNHIEKNTDYVESLVDDLVQRKTSPQAAALKVINPS